MARSRIIEHCERDVGQVSAKVESSYGRQRDSVALVRLPDRQCNPRWGSQ
jgi:hypothetical protein